MLKYTLPNNQRGKNGKSAGLERIKLEPCPAYRREKAGHQTHTWVCAYNKEAIKVQTRLKLMWSLIAVIAEGLLAGYAWWKNLTKNLGAGNT